MVNGKYILLIALFILLRVNNAVSFTENKNMLNEIENIKSLCNSFDYTIIYSLSISDCLGCYNSKIITINEFFLKKDKKINIIYVFKENLNKNELKVLNEKYKDGIVTYGTKNNISNLLHLNTNELFLLFDHKGKELVREKLHLIKAVDDNLLESQILKFTEPIKLKNNENIFLVASNIEIKNNRLLVLDKVQNIINCYNSINGEALYSISIPNEIKNYFKNSDSTYNWKWNYVPQADIRNFCLKNDTLVIFYRNYNAEVNFDTITNTINIDTNLTFYPNILIAKYFNDKLISIKHFRNNSYNFDFEGIRFNDDNYIVYGHEKIENNFPFVENPDSLSILLLIDSDFENIQSIVKKEDIQNVTGKKYYSFFGINNILIDDNNIFVINLLNSTLFLIENFIENKKQQIKNIKPYGIIKKNFDLISNQEIKPWDFLKNPDEYNLPSNTLDIGLNEQNYIIFALEENSYNLIQNIQILTYNKNGSYKKTYQINYDEKDEIYDFKYVGFDENKLHILIKWKNNGWCLHNIQIE